MGQSFWDQGTLIAKGKPGTRTSVGNCGRCGKEGVYGVPVYSRIDVDPPIVCGFTCHECMRQMVGRAVSQRADSALKSEREVPPILPTE